MSDSVKYFGDFTIELPWINFYFLYKNKNIFGLRDSGEDGFYLTLYEDSAGITGVDEYEN